MQPQNPTQIFYKFQKLSIPPEGTRLKPSKYLSTFQYNQSSILLYLWNLSQPRSNLPPETFQYNLVTPQNPIGTGIPAYPNPLQNLYGF